MAKSYWLDGGGLAIFGVGFVFASVQTVRLQEQVRDQEAKIHDLEGQTAKSAQDRQTLASLDEEVRRLRDDLDRLGSRKDAPPAVGGPRPASASSAAKGPDDAAAAPEPDVVSDAVRRVLEEQKAQQKADRDKARKEWEASRAERQKADRVNRFVRGVGLDPSQGPIVQPILEEEHDQRIALYQKMRDAAEAGRQPIRDQLTALRQATEEKLRPYLNTDQAAKMDQYFAASNGPGPGGFQGRGGGRQGGRSDGAAAPAQPGR